MKKKRGSPGIDNHVVREQASELKTGEALHEAWEKNKIYSYIYSTSLGGIPPQSREENGCSRLCFLQRPEDWLTEADMMRRGCPRVDFVDAGH